MCYATTLRKTEKVIEERFNANVSIPLLYKPFYYQSGFEHKNLFIITQDSPNEINPANWGFVPEFGKTNIPDFYKQYNTLNAKSETVFTSNTFRESIITKRCLIIADGFFEPHHFNEVSYPHFCHLKSDELFAFAGIYSEIDNDVFSCSILTTKANDFFEQIHNKKKRMPIVLDKQFEKEWLRNDLEHLQIKELIKVGFTSDEFEAYPILRKFNKSNFNRNHSQSIERVSYPKLMYTQGNLFI